MPIDMRTWNPRGCLVSVIDDPRVAQQALRALHGVGFGDNDLRLVLPDEITQIGDTPANCGWFTRIARGVGSLGDESVVAAGYLDEARRGHQLLIVYAPRADLKRGAHAVVAGHQAHGMMYYGRWVITSHV